MLEKEIQTKILKWINEQPRCHAFKISGFGMFQKSGISDILACINGRFVAIEVKAPGKSATPLQTKFLNIISECGGLGFVVTSLEAVQKVVTLCS